MAESTIVLPHRRFRAIIGEWTLELSCWLFLTFFLLLVVLVKGVLVLRCMLSGGHDWLEPVDEDLGDGFTRFDFGRPDTVCRRGCGCRK